MTKVAVGDDDHVFALGNDSSVQRLVWSPDGYSYTPVDLGAGVPNPTHMAANADGTLWHCNSTNANTFRLISESTKPLGSITLSDKVTSVQKVASTGFGAAHCLVKENGQTQLYRYDSPYLFKTAGDCPILGNGSDGIITTGSTFAQGLGNLYGTQFVESQFDFTIKVRFVALDAHTGREVASKLVPFAPHQYTGLVFDPINELIYVGTAPLAGSPDQTASAQLVALDARTLAVTWRFFTTGGVDAAPALSGTQLCFGDRTGTLYMIDTRAALAAAKQSKAITAEWTWAVPTGPADTHRIASPVIAGDKVYAVAWDLITRAINGNGTVTTTIWRYVMPRQG